MSEKEKAYGTEESCEENEKEIYGSKSVWKYSSLCIYICMCIYIYIERERESERNANMNNIKHQIFTYVACIAFSR